MSAKTKQQPVKADDDWCHPYECGVCKQSFTSRHLLATHPHPKKKESAR